MRGDLTTNPIYLLYKTSASVRLMCYFVKKIDARRDYRLPAVETAGFKMIDVREYSPYVDDVRLRDARHIANTEAKNRGMS
jgi:hypothetical protein